MTKNNTEAPSMVPSPKLRKMATAELKAYGDTERYRSLVALAMKQETWEWEH